MQTILTLSRAISIDGRLTLLSAPFDRQGRILDGFALNPQAPEWYEPFRKVKRHFATAIHTAEVPGVVLAETEPGSLAWIIADELARMEACYSAAAIDAYRAFDAAQAEGDGHATL
jgi:hypothetical protein